MSLVIEKRNYKPSLIHLDLRCVRDEVTTSLMFSVENVWNLHPVLAPKMPLTILPLCIQCSTGCSSWLGHMLLLCSLKVEFCLVSPLLVAFPDIFHRAVKVSGYPFANSLSSETAGLQCSACFLCDCLYFFPGRR